MKTLIVVDMQNDFIDGALGTEEAKAIVPNVIKKIEAANEETLILFTKDTHGPNYMEIQEGKNLPVPHCIYEPGKVNEGWYIQKAIRSTWMYKKTIIIDPEIVPYIGENNTINKPTFGSVDLAKVIQAVIDNKDGSGVEIELVGLCTDICVISNAMLLKAFMPEAKISVDATCCAGVTPDSHENALKAMEMCQIEIKR